MKIYFFICICIGVLIATFFQTKTCIFPNQHHLFLSGFNNSDYSNISEPIIELLHLNSNAFDCKEKLQLLYKQNQLNTYLQITSLIHQNQSKNLQMTRQILENAKIAFPLIAYKKKSDSIGKSICEVSDFLQFVNINFSGRFSLHSNLSKINHSITIDLNSFMLQKNQISIINMDINFNGSISSDYPLYFYTTKYNESCVDKICKVLAYHTFLSSFEIIPKNPLQYISSKSTMSLINNRIKSDHSIHSKIVVIFFSEIFPPGIYQNISTTKTKIDSSNNQAEIIDGLSIMLELEKNHKNQDVFHDLHLFYN